MTLSNQPLRIDIISDVMCPWCIVGYKQLTAALRATGTAHEIHWHPFELNPDMPQTGQNLREHIMEKYGSTAQESEESRKHLTKTGADLGFAFQFSDDSRMHNTFNTHQLLHWANQTGQMDLLKQALFTAHFSLAQDLSDNAVLADIAASVGLDRDKAMSVLTDQRFADTVRQEQAFWIQQGIRGVPAVVFDRQHLVTGAQGVDNFTSILKQITQEPT